MSNKPAILAVISFVAAGLGYGSFSNIVVFALPPDPNWETSGTCGATTRNPETGEMKQTCCWTERVPGYPGPKPQVRYCQTCSRMDIKDALVCGNVTRQLLPAGAITPEE